MLHIRSVILTDHVGDAILNTNILTDGSNIYPGIADVHAECEGLVIAVSTTCTKGMQIIIKSLPKNTIRVSG